MGPGDRPEPHRPAGHLHLQPLHRPVDHQPAAARRLRPDGPHPRQRGRPPGVRRGETRHRGRRAAHRLRADRLYRRPGLQHRVHQGPGGTRGDRPRHRPQGHPPPVRRRPLRQAHPVVHQRRPARIRHPAHGPRPVGAAPGGGGKEAPQGPRLPEEARLRVRRRDAPLQEHGHLAPAEPEADRHRPRTACHPRRQLLHDARRREHAGHRPQRLVRRRRQRLGAHDRRPEPGPERRRQVLRLLQHPPLPRPGDRPRHVRAARRERNERGPRPQVGDALRPEHAGLPARPADQECHPQCRRIPHPQRAGRILLRLHRPVDRLGRVREG